MRAMNVVLDDARLVVDLMDGRTIAVPLALEGTPFGQRYARATQTIGSWPVAATSIGPILTKI